MKKFTIILFVLFTTFAIAGETTKEFHPTDYDALIKQGGKGEIGDGSEVNLGLNDEKVKNNQIDKQNVQSEQISKINGDVFSTTSTALIVTLIILFFISLITNYTLLKWRSRSKNQLISFPENLQDQFESLSKEFNDIKSSVHGDFGNYTENLKKQINLHQEVAKNVTKKYDEIFESFSVLQKSLNQKDDEIERLKKGYDLQILKKYVIKLLRVADTCDAIENDPKVSEETKKETTFISESLNDLLEDLGVEKYSIKPGVSTKSEVFGLPPANEWVKVKADKEEQLSNVKKTIKEGYFINAEIKEVIKYPKIEVYTKGEK